MQKQYFSLEINENNKLTKIFRLLMGIVCVVVGIFWIIFNLHLLKTDNILWITIIFLFCFGFYQIWAALGMSARFIEIGTAIRLKKNTFMPVYELKSSELKKIEIFPLNIIFYLKSGKKIKLRLGTMYYETNEKIIDGIIGFAENNSIPFEIIEEKL